MEAQQTRLDSFKKSKRVKNPTKTSSTTTLKWPHPKNFKANPETLAEAGFYYDPSYEDPDNVTCYICEKELSGWEVDDDPFLVHWTKCGQTCCWASVRCGLSVDLDGTGRFISSDSSRVPSAKPLEKARLETFAAGKGWIHDKDRNHGANSKMMARAGFVFTPQLSGDDLATCVYCNTSLSGWDAEDDPVEEHRKRANRSNIPCPFFVVTAGGPTNTSLSRSQSSKPPSKSQSKPASRSTSRSKHQDVLLPTKTHDGDPDAASDSARSSVPTTTAKTPRKPRSTSGSRKSSAKTPRGKARSTSQSSLKNVAEADEEEEEVPVAPPTVKKNARARSKSVARSEATEQTEVEDDEQELQRKPSRSRAKSRAPENVDDDASRQPSRSKSKPTAAAPAQIEDEASRKPSRTRSKSKMLEVEEHEEPPIMSKPKKTTRTPSRSKPKVPIAPPGVESEEELQGTTAAPNRGRKPKPKAQVPPVESLFDEDIVMDNYAPNPPSPPASFNQPSTIELPPLFVPKRTTNPPEKVQPVEKEKRKPGRPKGKTKSTAAPAKEDDKVEIEPDIFTTSHAPLAPVSNNPFPPSLTKGKAVEEMKTLVKKEDSIKVPMKVVEISSDEEDEGPNLEPESNSRADADDRDKENTQKSTKSTTIPQPDFGTKPTSTPDKKPKEVFAKGMAPSTAAPFANVTASLPKIAEPDITTDHIEASVKPGPSTPPAKQSSLNLEPENNTRPPVASVEPAILLIVPPLSKLPFTPLHALNEAELDMTVEEWIRYQMEIEYDKFRRDGERELQRFRQRAEEVRKVIEGL